MLEVKNLKAQINDTQILNGINFKVASGEVHAVMGPNGSGKSTFAKVIAGHPAYKITDGEINFDIDGKIKNLKELEMHERAKNGIFLGFQYPIEISGISNFTFLYEAHREICRYHDIKEMGQAEFRNFLNPKLELLEMNPTFLERSLNEGFSGGEKKKNEILQMLILNPKLAILDETDSGLDIDALKIVSKGVNSLKNKNNAIVLVTHYQRLLDYIVPDFVHVIYKGQIIKSGDKNLALELEEKGYDWIIK